MTFSFGLGSDKKSGVGRSNNNKTGDDDGDGRNTKRSTTPTTATNKSNNKSNNNINNNVFVDDDEETWKKIVSVGGDETDSGKETGLLLSSLSERLQKDWHSISSGGISNKSDEELYWEELLGSIKVIAGTAQDSYKTKVASGSRAGDGEDGSLPEAFRMENGIKHLEATTALLGLSKQRAVQVTMGALRSVDTAGDKTGGNSRSSSGAAEKTKADNDNSNDNFSSLLGTRELLAKTLVYHHKQRSARLSVLAECLRLEQDPSSPISSVVAKNLLDPLDAMTESSTPTTTKRKRGLFKSLLVVASLQDPTPKLESLEPAKKLSGSYSAIASSGNNVYESSYGMDDTSLSTRFGTDLFSEIVTQRSRERTQAMECLLALLYQRLDEGIDQTDFGLLVMAFFGPSSASTKDIRWYHLAGLVCAECMALWRAFEPPTAVAKDARGNPTSYDSWTKSHPLLLDKSLQSIKGIDALQGLAQFLTECFTKTAAASSATRSPLSLVLLSFGLLLCLASDDDSSHSQESSPRTLHDMGEQLVNLASDEGGAFDNLSEAISNLTQDALADAPAPVSHEIMYDWQLFMAKRNRKTHGGESKAATPMLLNRASSEVDRSIAPLGTSPTVNTTASKKTISADVVTCTSIAREILAALIASFSENLLAIDTINSCQNIGMLCQLVAVIFKNNEPLCQQFWESWESYLSCSNNSTSSVKFPICRLLDAAYNLSREYLTGFFQGQIQRDEFLGATAPFFRLLSVLCNTPAIFKTMIEMLPSNLIRTALQCCVVSEHSNAADASLQNLVFVLESLNGFTKIASSSMTCLSLIRRALEPDDGTADDDYSFEGPLLLASILNNPADSQTTRYGLGTIANLLRGAPKGWAVLMAQQFIDLAGGSGGSATSRLVPFVWTDEEPLSQAAILVLEELVGHTGQIVFGGESLVGSSSASSILAFLQSLGAVLLTAMTSLATTRISTASVETAEIVFRSLSEFLKWIKPIVRLHSSPLVRDGASKLRDYLIQNLATSNGLGEVLVYYSTAPVSLGIVLKMEESVVDQAIAEQVARDDDTEAAQKFGPWYSMSSSYKGRSSGASISKAKVLDFLSSMTPSDFDLSSVQAKGWTWGSNPNGLATLEASLSAIRLLLAWASSVDDIAETHMVVSESISQPLLEGDAKTTIINLSPRRLLCTMAPMPVQCHSNARMSTLWQSLEVSTFDLLLPYLHIERSQEEVYSMPLPNVLNLVNSCLSHLRLTVPKEELATSFLLRKIVQSSRFSALLLGIIERGIELTGEMDDDSKITETNQKHYRNAFLGLQILSSCVASTPTVAHSILGLDKKDKPGVFCSKLVKGALYAKMVLKLTGSGDIFASDGSILQMRMASGCLNVLSGLWKSTQILTLGKTKVGSSLLEEIDSQASSLIPDLMQLVSDYANSKNLEDRITISNATEFGRVSTMSFFTSALETLSYAHMYETSKEGKNGTIATLDILTKFSKSRRLLRSNNYALSVTSTEQIWEISEHVGLQRQDPLCLLSSFPALASNLQTNDFYRRENSFDVNSLARWLASIEGANGSNNSIEDLGIIRDALDKASLLQHLTTAELHLMESWKNFLEIAVFKVYFSNGCVITGSTLEILKNLTLDTLYSLGQNLSGGASAQAKFSKPFMSREIYAMSSCLSDLLLFQLEIGAFDLLPLGELLEIASTLAAATKSLQDVACPEPNVESATQLSHLQHYCKHQQTLLSCSLVVCGLIEKREHSRPDHGVQADIYLFLSLTNCKFVKAFSSMCSEDNICQKAHTTTIRSCASFFTLLVIGYKGDRSSNASYTTVLSKSFREYEVLKLLMQYATVMSTFVGNNLSSAKSNTNPSAQDREILDVIKAVFNLLHAIADTNDPEMIGTLHGLELSQLAVRNPLFNVRAPMWSQQDPTKVQPRGYVFKKETVTISSQKSSIYVGSEDPVYEIWLASMQVLGACVRTSTHYLNDSGGKNLGTKYLDMSIEFLRIHKAPLLVCLKSCVNPSKKTRFALREAKVLSAMVAELCKRNVRASFASSNLKLREDFLEHSKFAMTSLSTFLGAIGTSCELFTAIEEYESTDQDRFEALKMTPLSQLRLSLLSVGLPMAKQKAMRLSNYASSRLKKISQEDFETATVVPDYLKSLSQKRGYESNSEQICRLSVTNQFSLGLVQASAEFVCQALSLVLRTHAISKSFYTFSDADRTTDYMNLVEPGIVIGYSPNIGSGMLFDDDSSGFERLRFGRVLKVDTFSRTWEVEVIRQEGNDREILDGRKEIVQAVQMAGIEDKSARIPSSMLAPAPDSMADFESVPGYLTTGNYILILRWCHQQTSLFQAGSSPQAGFEIPSYIRQISEQASILLGADLVLHGLIGSFQNKDKKEMSRLDDQVFELFADRGLLIGNLENEEPASPPSFPEGRMKEVIDASVWKSLQSQVRPFVHRAWKIRQEIERKRREKRSGDTEFFSGFRRKGNSAFRR